jgi:hypothetical protein
MRGYSPAPLLILLGLAAACTPIADRDKALAAEIERQVAAAHPSLPMKRFARFYAHETDGSIRAVYLYANEGSEPILGKAGSVIWTTPDKLPVVYDGGCSVVTVTYDPGPKKLTGARCNGVA